VSEHVIRPEDVSAADAGRILDFLNSAGSVDQIAERIELPDEPDVGVRLAARLLAHRGEHGPFTNVAQLLDVPLIGPVRFSRIVRSLTATLPPPPVDPAAFDALVAQVTSLRTSLEALQVARAHTRPEHLIAAQDVAAADATRILAFLNAAASADEIAQRIELPDEPDVGHQLGARLLAYRGEHGPFTALGQLLDVPLIGPVRFDRIVRSFTEAPPVAAGVDSAAFDALAAQVASLHAAAAAPRVELRAVEQQRYVGQPQTLVATVTGPDGLRPPGISVTLTATWGRLAGSDGFSVAVGTSITLVTAGDGTVRARLLPWTAEDLQQTQQASLELHLGALDPAAATPADAAGGLASLERAYRFEANDAFRAAVDIYHRDLHPHLLENVNFRDALQEWANIDSAVVAYVQDGDATSVVATAALVVRFRDWLPALAQTHLDAATGDALFTGDLQLATNLTDPSDVLSRIHRRVGDFVSFQQGSFGRAVAQQVADEKLGQFLENGLDALPDDHKQLLFPAVASSSDTVSTLGVQALGAIEQTRTDVRASVDAQIATGLEQSPALASLQAAVASKVSTSQLNAALASKVDVTTLKDQLAAANDFSAFKSSLSNVFLQSPNLDLFHP
jgi:DNA uptake protein ComE-like DNA-binding protein